MENIQELKSLIEQLKTENGKLKSENEQLKKDFSCEENLWRITNDQLNGFGRSTEKLLTELKGLLEPALNKISHFENRELAALELED